MMTVFERVPEFFVERYNEEMLAWGRNFKKIGPVKQFVLREGVWAASSPDPEQGAVLIAVKLLATIKRGDFGNHDNDRVIVSPLTDEDEAKIRHHCERMSALGVSSRLFSKEPPRPWIPTMPRIDPINDNSEPEPA